MGKGFGVRRRYTWIDGKGWVERERRSDSRLQIIRDEAEPFQSQATGRVHDSKSAYRRELREHGFIEMGNDRPTPQPYRPLPDWGDVIHRAAADRGL